MAMGKGTLYYVSGNYECRTDDMFELKSAYIYYDIVNALINVKLRPYMLQVCFVGLLLLK